MREVRETVSTPKVLDPNKCEEARTLLAFLVSLAYYSLIFMSFLTGGSRRLFPASGLRESVVTYTGLLAFISTHPCCCLISVNSLLVWKTWAPWRKRAASSHVTKQIYVSKFLSLQATLLPTSNRPHTTRPCDIYSSVYGCHLQQFLTIICIEKEAAKKGAKSLIPEKYSRYSHPRRDHARPLALPQAAWFS